LIAMIGDGYSQVVRNDSRNLLFITRRDGCEAL
jgi:hypothetical protein